MQSKKNREYAFTSKSQVGGIWNTFVVHNAGSLKAVTFVLLEPQLQGWGVDGVG